VQTRLNLAPFRSVPNGATEQPELAIDTTGLGIDEAVQRILLKLEHEGYLR
jgi:sulfate adenylyltransferase